MGCDVSIHPNRALLKMSKLRGVLIDKEFYPYTTIEHLRGGDWAKNVLESS